jgi:hypothetical protein
MFYSGQNLTLGRAVALELIGDDNAWHVLQPLEQLAKKLLGGLLVPAALHQDIQYVVVLVDSAPQVMALAIDGQEDFIKMPFVPWLGSSTFQLIRVILPKLATLLADGFMGNVDTTFAQQLLYIAVAQTDLPPHFGQATPYNSLGSLLLEGRKSMGVSAYILGKLLAWGKGVPNASRIAF